MKFPVLFLFVLFACNAPAPKTPAIVADTLKPGAISLGNFTFLDFDEQGDENLFIVCKDSDTLFMICNTPEHIPYEMGDKIGLAWKDSAYSPAGDPESSYTAHFVQQHTLVSEGHLSRFLKSHPVTFTFVFEEEPTDYAHDVIFKRACYYMANTTSQPLRSIVDKHTDSVSIQVQKMNEGFLLRFKHATDSLPQLFLDFGHIYQLQEYDGVSLKPAI
jgi:hypothetical protein